MRGVLGRVSAATAERIFDSANPREIRAKQKAVSVAAKARENTAREHKFLGGNRGNLLIKEFRRDSTPPVREKRRVDTRETTKDCSGHE